MGWNKRPDSQKRLAGRKLQERRERKRQEDPLCWMCRAKGRVRAWTQLDHKIPLFLGGEDTDENTAGLCDPCHEAKSLKEKGYRVKPKTGPDGWPITD